MSEDAALEIPRRPTVYFIDDSATMREVMKIAFRREDISVVACQDATAALAEMEESPPDVVITDIVMPEKDGFEVCEFIKHHPRLNKTPVVLLSGEINREVAEKAAGVKADDLIRKPFQPQELIARVRGMLAPQTAAAPTPAVSSAPKNGSNRGAALSAIFSHTPGPARSPASPPVPALAARLVAAAAPSAAVPRPPRAVSPDTAKLRLEIVRLETLVKKLQSELAAERDYVRALEAHVKTLQESE
jgi:CheY-like chemotaxis protein